MNKSIYDGGIEEAAGSYVIFENAIIIILLVLGFLGMAPLTVKGIPVVSIGYILYVVVMLLFVLRKHLCTHCYYYGKVCHCGWGTLSGKLYDKGSGNQKLGGILAGVTWGIIFILPLAVMIIMLITGKTMVMDGLVYLAPFILLVMINGYLHKVDCEQCKMRYICPGSAAKKQK